MSVACSELSEHEEVIAHDMHVHLLLLRLHGCRQRVGKATDLLQLRVCQNMPCYKNLP